jgi:tricorn protease-like protein
LRAWSVEGLRDGALWVAGRAGGGARRLLAAPRIGVDAVGWLADELVFLVRADLIMGDRPTMPLGLYAIRPDGGGMRRLLSGGILEASLAQGGSVVVARTSDGIVFVDARGGARSLGDPRQWFSPSWSPDGRRLVFSSEGELYASRPDGSGRVRLTSGQGNDVDPAFSPDGRSLV